MGGLVAQGSFVEEVAEDTQGEDCYGEEVASVACVSACELRDDFVVVFWWG